MFITCIMIITIILSLYIILLYHIIIAVISILPLSLSPASPPSSPAVLLQAGEGEVFVLLIFSTLRMFLTSHTHTHTHPIPALQLACTVLEDPGQ